MVLRLIRWILAFAITPWLFVAGFIYGIYRLTLVAPGLVIWIAAVLIATGMWMLWKLLTKERTNG